MSPEDNIFGDNIGLTMRGAMDAKEKVVALNFYEGRKWFYGFDAGF